MHAAHEYPRYPKEKPLISQRKTAHLNSDSCPHINLIQLKVVILKFNQCKTNRIQAQVHTSQIELKSKYSPNNFHDRNKLKS